jgi:malate dehydrogenase
VLEGEYGISGCSLGVPVRIGKDGILSIEEWHLDSWEQDKMNKAGTFVKELCQKAIS